MSYEDEKSWRLLFDIALSHGDALRSKRLTQDGWMVFLSSAELIGTHTGVFPVLIDELWSRQALSAATVRGEGVKERAFLDASDGLAERHDHARAPRWAAHGDRTTPPPSLGGAVAPQGCMFVEFGGFVDMLKVLCLRVFQASQLADARGLTINSTSTDEAFLEALRRCAEDRVLLTEAVHFTASRYLRPFIAKSTIHARSRVSLHARHNGWARHVNRLLTHIVGSLMRHTILPLYSTYAVIAGRMSAKDYRAFLKDYLPGLNSLEETCAVAVFERGGFADARPVFQQVAEAGPPPADVALLAATPTIGLTDFVEALLMLAVVMAADEARAPELRAITAKVWWFFEHHICGGAKGATRMCVDPYAAGHYAAVAPGLAAVVPSVVPLMPPPVILVELCNAAFSDGAAAADGPEAGAGHPAAAVLQPLASSSSPGSDGDGETPFLTEVPPLSSTEGRDREAPGCVAVEAAAPLFHTQWSLMERNAAVALFGEPGGCSRCEVLVGGTAVAATPTACPNIWLLSLSALALPTVKLLRCAVDATASPSPSGGASVADSDAAVRLVFTPIRSLPVELVSSAPEPEGSADDSSRSGGVRAGISRAGAAECVAWGCKDVVFTDTAVTQVVSPALVQALRDRLTEMQARDDAQPPTAVATTAAATTAGTRYSQSVLCELCRQLQWIPAAGPGGTTDLPRLCSQALANYRHLQHTLHPDTAPAGRAGPDMSFLELVGCLAVLSFRSDARGLRDIPDVPQRLAVSLHTTPALRTAAESGGAAAAAPSASVVDLRRIPHNKLRDEPFKLALERKEVQSAASQERRAALLQTLREHHARQLAGPVTLPTLPERRPHALPLISQYGNVDQTGDFQRVMREAAETVRAHFMEKELAIPEWSRE